MPRKPKPTPTEPTSTSTSTSTPTPPPTDCAGVQVPSWGDIQAAINANPEGAQFCIAPGTYHPATTLTPKAGQKFVSVVPRQAIITGQDTVTVGINCSGKPGVELHGLVFEHFATPDTGGQAAVKLGVGSVASGLEVRNNRYIGIYHEADCKIMQCSVHDNGVSGIVGYKSHRSIIADNQIFLNGSRNLAGLSGGTKWTLATDMQIVRNWLWDNTNNGIWFDGGNLNYLIDRNTVRTSGRGIHLEVSCPGTTSNNTLERNQNTAIEIVCSRGCDIFGNQLVENANGIRAQYQPLRSTASGSGFSFVDVNCEWDTIDCTVHDNEINQAAGINGMVRYPKDDQAPFTAAFQTSPLRCRWYNNHYYFRNLTRPFAWADITKTIGEWQTIGQDTGSTFGTY